MPPVFVYTREAWVGESRRPVADFINPESLTMRCMITGAAGFIGSSLADLLLSQGHEVIGIDCYADYYPREIKESNIAEALRHPRFTFVEEDLLAADLGPLLKGVDWVFHQAAQAGVRASWGSSFDTYARNNILVTQRLLESAKGSAIKRLVYASSSSIYGDSPELPLRESARPQPVSPYGVTKLAAEHLCYLYHVNYGVPTVSLRYFTVYGPRQRPDMAFNKFIRAALQGDEIVVHGDGEQTRDFTFISDICNANLLAAQTDEATGRIFNVGGGSRVTVNYVLEILSKLSGGQVKVRHIEDQKGDVRHTLSDATPAREILGYSTRVSVEEGLAREFEWLKNILGTK